MHIRAINRRKNRIAIYWHGLFFFFCNIDRYFIVNASTIFHLFKMKLNFVHNNNEQKRKIKMYIPLSVLALLPILAHGQISFSHVRSRASLCLCRLPSLTHSRTVCARMTFYLCAMQPPRKPKLCVVATTSNP